MKKPRSEALKVSKVEVLKKILETEYGQTFTGYVNKRTHEYRPDYYNPANTSPRVLSRKGEFVHGEGFVKTLKECAIFSGAYPTGTRFTFTDPPETEETIKATNQETERFVKYIYDNSVKDNGTVKKYFRTRMIEIPDQLIDSLGIRFNRWIKKGGEAEWSIVVPLKNKKGTITQLNRIILDKVEFTKTGKKLSGNCLGDQGILLPGTNPSGNFIIIEGLEDALSLWSRDSSDTYLVTCGIVGFDYVESFIEKLSKKPIVYCDWDKYNQGVVATFRLKEKVIRKIQTIEIGYDANKALLDDRLDEWVKCLRNVSLDEVYKLKQENPVEEKVQEIFTEEEALKFMNDKYSLVNMSGQTVVLHEGYDQEFKRSKLDFQKTGDFHTWWQYAKVSIENGTDNQGKPKYDYIPISKWWIGSGKRKMFINGIVFNPGYIGHRGGSYNMFKGLGCESIEGDCSLYIEHMRKIICGGNKEMFNYVFNWMAHSVQKIDEKPRVAIVLRGGEGIGKGRFIDFFGELFGSHYLQLIDGHHLTGNFNSHLKDIIMIFADESVWAGDHKAEQKLKGLISERRTVTELKGKDGFQTLNYQRIMMSSNADWCVPVSADSRRYVIMNVKADRKEDKDYFIPLSEQMDNGGKEALLYMLLNHDISDFDLTKRPTNDALLEQKLLTLDGPKQFLIHEFRNGNLSNRKRATSELYTEYLYFSSGKWKDDPARFGLSVHKLFPELKKKRETAEGKREYHYLFPSALNMLNSLEKFFGHKIDLGVDDLIEEESTTVENMS